MRLNFIDFCSGIGGGRLALESLGMKCVGFSEIDPKAEKTYKHFFNHTSDYTETNYGDLMHINPSAIPNFDLMLSGFPCQTFSIVGQRSGFKDPKGQIIFGLIEILKAKQIKYFILENVKGLLNHQQGQTFKTIFNLLKVAGYQIIAKLMDSSHYGLPHKRQRIYFIGIKDDLKYSYRSFYDYFSQYPQKTKMNNIRKYLIDQDNIAFKNCLKSYQTFLNYLQNKYNKGCISIKRLMSEEFLIIDTRQSDLRLYREAVPTLRTGRHGLLYVREGQLRRLTGYEALLLQGFPQDIACKVKGRVPENQILSQAGNAMTVNVVKACSQALLDFIHNNQQISTLPKRSLSIKQEQPLIL